MKSVPMQAVKFVRRHYKGIAIGVVVTSVMVTQQRALSEALEFIAEKDLNEEYIARFTQ